MNIGDKVRMLRAKEQGVVTRLLPSGQVEIEIEDGFRIPVLRSELVVVSPVEAERLGTPSQTTSGRAASGNVAPGSGRAGARPTSSSGNIQPRNATLVNKGLFLAFVPQNDREVAVHVVNTTDWDVLLTIGEASPGEERNGTYRALQSATLNARQTLALNERYRTADFERWPTWVVQALWFRANGTMVRPPLVKRLRPKAATFYKQQQNVPLLNQKGALLALDDEPDATSDKATSGSAMSNVATSGRNVAPSPEALRTALLSPNEPNMATEPTIPRPTDVVDLHIEALLPAGPAGGSASRQPATDLLNLQLRTFEDALDRAVAASMPEITFIHGVGSGALRQELHRRLSRHPHVRYFEDAQKQKFGYGATKVTLK